MHTNDDEIDTHRQLRDIQTDNYKHTLFVRSTRATCGRENGEKLNAQLQDVTQYQHSTSTV